MTRTRRLRRLGVLALVIALVLLALLFGPFELRADRARSWWTSEKLWRAPARGDGATTLRGARIAVLELDDHPAARGAARRLADALEARFAGADVERFLVADAPYEGGPDGRLADLVALVDRVHSDERFLPGYAHQMLRLNVAFGASPRMSTVAGPEAVDVAGVEYSIDGHADAFGLIPWGRRWDGPAERVARDLIGVLDDPRVVVEVAKLPALAPGAGADPPELPFRLDGALAGEAQELYRGLRASGAFERQWQLTTTGSGVGAVEAARERALAAGWSEVGAALRADGRPRSVALRSGASWLHVRPAYMEGTVRDDPDAPQVLTLLLWRLVDAASRGSTLPPR